MAYSILLEKKTGGLDEIPISTHDLFHEYWLPLFEKYKLVNLLNLQYPHDLDKNEIDKIITEYEKLKPYLKGAWEKERVEFIISKLKVIKYDNYEFINIG